MKFCLSEMERRLEKNKMDELDRYIDYIVLKHFELVRFGRLVVTLSSRNED